MSLTYTLTLDPSQGWCYHIREGERLIQMQGGFRRQSNAEATVQRKLLALTAKGARA